MKLILPFLVALSIHAKSPTVLFNDSHFHLTNYIQEGITLEQFLKIIGDKVGRVALFGIPLQQQWASHVSGKNAPTYYLNSDAPLYYYSFTDAQIAMAYKALSEEEKAHFDPMITGFNPADMYAADHVRRVLKTFPGVFTGIGEFTIHKEFVSAKIAGGPASAIDPALDRLLDFAAEAGLVAIIHNDIDTPFFRRSDLPGGVKASKPAYLDQMKSLLKKHPKASIIWAHIGLGRVVGPAEHFGEYIESMLNDSELKHVSFDISWDETAKYLMATPETTKRVADVINRFPERFLFGTDTVAPKDAAEYFKVYEIYEPLWKLLAPETSEKVRIRNYERLFDAARKRVRAWEKTAEKT